LFNICRLGRLDIVVTDNHPGAAGKRLFSENGVQLIREDQA